jgi:hypothetical protein
VIIRELLTKLGFQVDQKGITGFEKRLRQTKAALRSVANGTKATVRAIAGITVAATAAGAGLLKLVTSVTEVGDRAAKDAQRLGITAEAVQELGHAAKLSGADFGSVKMGLQIFSRHLGDALTKGGEAAEVFKRMGISMDDPVLRSRDLEKILPSLADRFAKMPDGAAKTALAMELFGRSGTDLIPLLNEGSEGLAAMRKELRDMGGVISNESAAAMEQFNDDLDRMKAQVGGVVASVVSDLLPTFQNWLTQLREWIGQNQELLKQKVREFVERVADALTKLAGVAVSLAPTIGSLVDMFSRLATTIGPDGMIAAIVAFKLAMTGLPGALAGIGIIVGTTLGRMAADLAGITRGVEDADQRIRALQAQNSAINSGTDAADTLRKLSKSGQLGDLPEHEFDRLVGQLRTGIRAGGEAAQEGARGVRNLMTANRASNLFESQLRDERTKQQAGRFTTGQSEARSSFAPILGQEKTKKKRGGGRRAKEKDKEPTLADLLGLDKSAADLGAFNSKAENPVLGTTINRYDFAPVMNLDVELRQRPGESSQGMADRLGDMIDKRFNTWSRRVFQHFRGATG